MADDQKQKAGDNANQTQVEVLNVNVGITEERVRSIVDEKLQIALQNFTTEATITAKERSEKFNRKVIDRMVEEKALSAFSDPSFQLLLIEAQKSAAATEREPDYSLLSELMVHRFKNGSNRMVRAGISRAVEIIDQISDEALLGLTVYHSVSHFIPVSGNMTQGLSALDDLFGKVIYNELPTNNEWLEHLDILDAVRVSPIGGTKLLEDYWYDHFDGYAKNGIKKDSEQYNKAIKILNSAGLGSNCLVKNDANEEYFKIEVLNRDSISKLLIKKEPTGNQRQVNADERDAFVQVYDLYDGSKLPKEKFITEIERYPNLKKLREWWNKLNDQATQITSVGRVLAHSNAQRVDKRLPPLN